MRDGLVDTNIVILLADLDENELPDMVRVSAVTLAELSVGPLVKDDPAERAAALAHLQKAEADFDPLPVHAAVARAYGRAVANIRSSGRSEKPRAFDVLIAATALAHGMPLYTCNPDDFRGISGLDLRSVTHPDHH